MSLFQGSKDKFTARPLDTTLFEDGVQEECEKYTWKEMREAVNRCVCPLQDNGTIICFLKYLL